MKQHSRLLYIIALPILTSASQAQVWLETSPNATTAYGGCLINFENQSSLPIRLTGRFDLNLSGPGGTPGSYRVYVKGGPLSGQERDTGLWTLLGATTIASSNPFGSYTTIDVGATYQIAPGQTIGLAFFQATNNASNGFVGYLSGANTYGDGVARISTGLAKSYRGGYDPNLDQLFDVDTFSPRTWSGRVEYEVVPEPASMAALVGGLGALMLRGRRLSGNN